MRLPLRNGGDGLTCGLESVKQVLDPGDGFQSSGGQEQIDYALQYVAEAYERDSVFGLQGAELSYNISEGSSINSHTIEVFTPQKYGYRLGGKRQR